MANETSKHIIKKAEMLDLDTVFNIISKCDYWLSKQGVTYWTNYYPKEKIAKSIQDESIYLIYDNGIPCGTATIAKTNPYSMDDNKFWNDSNAKALHISCLGVPPEYQGKGLAVELLDFAEDYAKKNAIKYFSAKSRQL